MAEVTTGQHQQSTRSFDDRSARHTLGLACEAAGIAQGHVELIRIGSNAVYRVGGQVIARIAPAARLFHNARKQIDVARWLEAADYPATRALPVDQPIQVDGRVATFWESISDDEIYAPIHDVGRLIRRLHHMVAPLDLDLPELRPFGAPGDELPPFDGLAVADADFLRRRVEWSRDSFAGLPFALPGGPVHGDANVGNVICDDRGHAALIDLDSFAVGPREWDLIQTALFFDRLGWHTEAEYRDFVDAYGYDIMGWDGYPALADMREIAMTSWIARQAATSTGAAAEATKRIAAIREGSSRRDWGAH
jgi:hypothetical protein